MTSKIKVPLLPYYDVNNKYEICIDECARGTLFGREYIAAVVIPINDEKYINNLDIKDSKKIHNKEKMRKISDYIKENAVAYHIHYIEAYDIDKINIREATLKGMRECVNQIIKKLPNINPEDLFILVDGNYFTPYMFYDEKLKTNIEIPYKTIEQGDAKYIGIASASIIAKVEHDKYIYDLCNEYPELKNRYDIHNNVGYGTAKHIEGLNKYGITQWHRKSYGICKILKLNEIRETYNTSNIPSI